MSRTFITPQAIGLDYWRYDAMRGEDTAPDGWVAHWPGDGHIFTGRSDESVRKLDGYEKYHVERKGWRGIAYDYAVDLVGRVYLLRGTGRSGATSGDFDEDGIPNNSETDAVLFLIGPDQQPSPEMIATARWLFTEFSPRRYVIGHRNAKGTVTSCPGDAVMAALPKMTSKEPDMPTNPVAIVAHGDVDNGEAHVLKAFLDRVLPEPVPVLGESADPREVGFAYLVGGGAAARKDEFPARKVLAGAGRAGTAEKVFQLIRSAG